MIFDNEPFIKAITEYLADDEQRWLRIILDEMYLLLPQKTFIAKCIAKDLLHKLGYSTNDIIVFLDFYVNETEFYYDSERDE